MDFKNVLINNFRKYPLSEARDIYKFVFHSAMGPGHAAADPDLVMDWLKFEINSLTEHDDPVLFDELCPESGLIRLHLRPYLKNGGDIEELCKAFLDTSKKFEPSHSRLRKLWGQAVELSSSAIINVPVTEMESFFLEMEARSYPAARHSEIYKDNYKPAYRVVSKNFLVEIKPKK